MAEIVYTLVSIIPMGKVTSYLSLSKTTGLHPRVIAGILRRNPNLIATPCHRVVYSNGRIGGYTPMGAGFKRKLLELEGVCIRDNRICRESFIDIYEMLLK